MALACLCHGVSERKIERAIDHGASTIEEVGELCKAGTCCMGCHDTITEMLVVRRSPRFAAA